MCFRLHVLDIHLKLCNFIRFFAKFIIERSNLFIFRFDKILKFLIRRFKLTDKTFELNGLFCVNLNSFLIKFLKLFHLIFLLFLISWLFFLVLFRMAFLNYGFVRSFNGIKLLNFPFESSNFLFSFFQLIFRIFQTDFQLLLYLVFLGLSFFQHILLLL